MDFESLFSSLAQNWHVWLVTITLVVAAIIDGKQLKVPNTITFPLIISGWVFNTAVLGWEGLGMSLLGTVVGLGLLLPAYAIGGMGAGDVKLLAGVGAWVGGTVTFYAFCVSAIVGGVIAVAMVLFQRGWTKHKNQFLMILNEIATVGNPTDLSAIAADRKSSMLLLPYGIPIAIGTILYFFWAGMLV
jgi:prepilin peptidase CpaA